MDDVALSVAEDLDLDVFGAADVAFEKDGRVAKSCARFLAGFGKFGFERGGRIDNAHPAAAAAESGFDNEREADFFSESFNVGTYGGSAGDDGNAGGLGQFAGGGFITQRVEQLGIRADEGDAGAQAGSWESGILGEKAVAWMNGVNIFFDSEINDGIDVEVGFDGAFPLTDEIGFVGFEAVEAEAVFLRIDGDCGEAQFSGGSKDAGGDLAAVQCEQFFHGVRRTKLT